ncbi:MAG TPA: NifB/NifX family molybdenum-iron cluster-binding protein [Bacteroidales bacterium]|nr:NifB/NifX family molybdenum-iron cluster-binding protein [Bacteroidales bacterium]HOW41503.1 NifB/NifX family molybdenum-iron cluster-binding protein [Bacteroidales bacterium]
MKIAVPVTADNQIDSHFGHCEFYKVFTISDKAEIDEIKRIDSPQGCGCKSDIASVLAGDGVKIMLAGGIGAGAINVLNHHGIEVIRGCSGDATEVVKLFLKGQVSDNGSTCNHDHHQHQHQHQHGQGCNHN